MNNKLVAWINVEERRLEWDKPTLWETPTVVKLDRIPLYTHPVKELTDDELFHVIRRIGYTSIDQTDEIVEAIRKASEK